MMSGCPECGSRDLDLVKQDTNSEDIETEQYICNECECEFEWEMRRSIIEHGKVPEV